MATAGSKYGDLILGNSRVVTCWLTENGTWAMRNFSNSYQSVTFNRDILGLPSTWVFSLLLLFFFQQDSNFNEVFIQNILHFNQEQTSIYQQKQKVMTIDSVNLYLNSLWRDTFIWFFWCFQWRDHHLSNSTGPSLLPLSLPLANQSQFEKRN